MSDWIERAKDFIKGYPDQTKYAGQKDEAAGEHLGADPDTSPNSHPASAPAEPAPNAAPEPATNAAPEPTPTLPPERADHMLDDGPGSPS